MRVLDVNVSFLVRPSEVVSYFARLKRDSKSVSSVWLFIIRSMSNRVISITVKREVSIVCSNPISAIFDCNDESCYYCFLACFEMARSS